MKRLITIVAAAALLAGCAEGAKSGGPVADPRSIVPPTATPPGPITEPVGSPLEQPTTGPATSPPATNSGQIRLEVWFDAGDGSTLARAWRSVPATQAVGRAALEALLDGPSERETFGGIGTQIPPGTELLGLSIADSIATVNLSRDYFSGGSAVSEWTRLGQVVWTITQFGTVDGVSIELDGDPIKPFDVDGNFLNRPWTREDFEFIAPAIVVDSPFPGDPVESPIEMTGNADVFEATVSYRLRNANGRVIAQGVATALCGTGCRGTFSANLDYSIDQDQDGMLQVYEESAKDGRPTNVVSIPVRLTA